MRSAGAQDRARIARALAYPYHRPLAPYVFTGGRALPWCARNLERCRSADLTPVLAVGSNAAPEQLARKFGRAPTVVIPVTTGRLQDHDVVFAAYMTAYGSLPATLIRCPGCVVDTAITWLDQEALSLMHQTESVGAQTVFGQLEGLTLQGAVSTGPANQVVDHAYTYRSCLGELAVAGRPVALWELGASDRPEPALTQQGLQRRLRRWMEPERLAGGTPAAESFAEWVLLNTGSADRREQITRWLQRHRIQTELPAFSPVSIARGSE